MAAPMRRAGELAEAGRSPSEALRVLQEQARWLADVGWPLSAEESLARRREVEEGRFRAELWIGPKDEAAGMVQSQPSGPQGRSTLLFLMPGYRSAGAVRSLFERSEEIPGPPTVILRIQGPELPAVAVAPFLEPRGFRQFERFDMVYPAARALPPRAPESGVRPLRPDDEEELAALLEDAYSDWPLDPAYFGDAPGLDGARAVVRRLLNGTYGRAWPGASVVVPRGGRLAGAVLVNDHHGPLITEVMVARGARGQGLARALLAESLTALRKEGAVPRLVVTATNGRARRLYGSIGFETVPSPSELTWFHPARRGRSELTELLPSLLGTSAPPAPPGEARSGEPSRGRPG